MNISVIIPTHNRPRQLRKCLKSIANQNFPKEEYEVLIVDDGSKSSTRDVFLEFNGLINIRYFYQKHMGPSGARNLGLKRTKADIIIFIDDDCVAKEDLLTNIHKAHMQYPDIDIFQTKVSLPPSANPFWRATQIILDFANKVRIRRLDKCQHALFLGTNGVSINRQAVEKHNLFFDASLRTREDEDLYRRIEQKKLTILYMPHICITHFSGCGPIVDFKRYFRYGQGEYHLQQKWGKYMRLKFPISFYELSKIHGVFQAALMRLIINLRKKAHSCGFEFERIQNNERTLQ